MSAFRPRNLASSDLSALVTDPDLASAEDRLAAVLATRASQSSVDNLGATLGPAIVDATADKATAAQVAAVLPPGVVQRFLTNKVPAGWQSMFAPGLLTSGGMGLNSSAYSSGLGHGDAVYVAQGNSAGLWRLRNGVLQCFDIQTNKAVGPEYPVPATGSGTQEHQMALYDGTKLYLMAVPNSSGAPGVRMFSFDTEAKAFTQLQSLGGTLVSTMLSAQLPDGRVLLRGSTYGGVNETQAARNFILCAPATNAAPVRLQVPLPFAAVPYTMAVLPSGNVLVIGATTEADGQTGSCVLTIAGDTITPGPAIPTGFTTATTETRALLPTASGAYHGALSAADAAGRVFTEGVGWSVPVPGPLAYGNSVNTRKAIFHPGLGWLCTAPLSVGGGGLAIGWVFTNSPYTGASVVDAIKL